MHKASIPFDRRRFHFEWDVPETPADPDSVDIIVQTIPTTDDDAPSINIRTTAHLTSFIEDAKRLRDVNKQVLVLIQDISPSVANILKQELGIDSSFADKHVQGRVNCPSQQIKKKLHAETLTTNLFGRSLKPLHESSHSITWWRLLSQNRENQKHEAEALVESKANLSRFVAPVFPYEANKFSAKTSRENAPTKRSGFWNKIIKESTGGYISLKKANIHEELIYKLDCHTYRPHQIITEVAGDMWGSACEERVSFCDSKIGSSNFCIVLLDKERRVKQYRREIQICHSNTTKIELAWNSESSKGTARIINEIGERSEDTFLTNKSNRASGLVRSTHTLSRTSEELSDTRSQAPEEEDVDLSTIGNSTRARLSQAPEEEEISLSTIGNSTRARLLRSLRDQPPERTSTGGPQILADLRSRFIDIVLEDWNHVLSQMSQTLDTVDSKISDDHELHENVPAWRRLLCSWRVNIIEYSSYLPDICEHGLQSQATRQISSPTSSRSRSRSVTTSDQGAQDDESPEVLRRYEILKNATKDLAARIDSSFHALMASMSIAESEKAISQGTAIGRLTELAFIFVPLNFACAFFSMQITNFQQPHQPNLGSFFGLGIGLIVLVYFLRAGLRSSLLAKLRTRLEKGVRKTKGFSPSSQIPTRVVIRYGWEEIHPYIRVSVISVLPLLGVWILIMVASSHTVFKALTGVVILLGIFPIMGNFLAGDTSKSLRLIGMVVWLVLILSATAERKDHLNIMTGVLPCIIYTTIFVIFLAFVRTFDRPLETSIQLILPQWIIGLPVAGVCYAYEKSKPHWEPWILTISLQAIVISFGIGVFLFRLKFYKGIPELATLIGITIGIPTSMIWQYLPPRGNPIPQYAVIALTFGCSIIYCIGIWVIPCLQNFRLQSFLHGFAQFLGILGSVAGLPCALAWAYYPTQGRLYTNDNLFPEGQQLSSFYGTPIQIWVQINITFGAVLLSTISLTIHSTFTHNHGLLTFAWLLVGPATIPWLPVLLWLGDVGIFEPLIQSPWKRKLLTGLSVFLLTLFWGILYYMGSKYVSNNWLEEFDDQGSRVDREEQTGMRESSIDA